MIKQIRYLTRIQICNLFQLNVIRNTKDEQKKKKYVAMSLGWGVLILMLMAYTGGAVFGFHMLGLGDLAPALLMGSVSMIVFFFTIFKASSVIFGMKAFELQMTLPVKKASIIISRFLVMYTTNFLLTVLVMTPGYLVLACLVKPGIGFYLYGLVGMFIIPLFPLTLAVLLGALITAVSARMKHKSMVSAFLSMIVGIAAIAGSMMFSSTSDMSKEVLAGEIEHIMRGQMGKQYPPALWMSEAMMNGNGFRFLLFAAGSILLFLFMIWVLERYFMDICTALNGTSAKGAYQEKKLVQSGMLKSLWKKELRRYFASSIYVSNTMMGYILMVFMAVALLVVGKDKVEELMKLPGMIERALPVVLGFMPIMCPITSCSISMEGKQWWLSQTLPIPMRTIIRSKVLLNLTIAAPFYVISECILLIALKPTDLNAVWLIIMPLLFIVFSALLGIAVNLKMPIFDWDNEVSVVKQSASTAITLLLGTIVIGFSLGCLLLFSSISLDLLMGGLGVFLILLNLFLWMHLMGE